MTHDTIVFLSTLPIGIMIGILVGIPWGFRRGFERGGRVLLDHLSDPRDLHSALLLETIQRRRSRRKGLTV